MSLQTRLSDFITAVGTDYKQLRTWITGSNTGTLTGLTTTAKTDLVAALNEVNAKPSSTPAAASETVAGVSQIATQAEVTSGTIDTDAVSPLKLAQKLTAWAQPLSTNLTNLAGVASTVFGRARLADADAAAAKTALGLAAVASSGSATDITTGILPSSVLPPLAINDVFTVATQAAMLALVAQRGDVAIRTDNNRSYILATDSPGTLADWKQLTAGGDVLSVAGRTGTIVLTATDVGLANVNNTSDANKPVSTAQASEDALRMLKTANLSDVASVATSRTNLSVYSQAEMGNPETDLVAAYTTAKA
jgi:hypothetical protein